MNFLPANVFHLSAECYPVAKVGGLGDVVGALPKYLQQSGVNASVVMPYYDRPFVRENKFEPVFEACGHLGHKLFDFKILRETTDKLGFPLYLIHIPGLLDRHEVYSYPDEREQFIAFQLAFLEWVVQTGLKPDVIHCHDHHTGLIPFLVSHSGRYNSLKNVPTVCTIHNGEYQGWFGWDKINYLPEIDLSKAGLLDWNGCINPLATSVKCCWKFTTVSPSYLGELSEHANGLELLFQMEKQKGEGIINGIDTQVWDPQTDKRLTANYNAETFEAGKKANKEQLCADFGLDAAKPLLIFIGRLVGEKGADLLPEIIKGALLKHKNKLNIIILGSGETWVEGQLQALASDFKNHFGLQIGYYEDLAHRLYAGADFIIMPSRVEPCGLNQLYSLRYGTMPLVNSTGGLKDTIIDVDEPGGYGIRFGPAETAPALEAIDRALKVFNTKSKYTGFIKRMMSLDFSWDKSARQYIDLYQRLKQMQHGIV